MQFLLLQNMDCNLLKMHILRFLPCSEFFEGSRSEDRNKSAELTFTKALKYQLITVASIVSSNVKFHIICNTLPFIFAPK